LPKLFILLLPGRRIPAGPFIAIDCPTIPETLLESELFGYRKSAFTGGNKNFPGKVRLAESGTLFLDEIGDFPLSIKAKLLRLFKPGWSRGRVKG